MTRQKIRIYVELDLDHDLVSALPEIPGIPGPDGHPPIPAIEIITEDLRSSLLAAVAGEIRRDDSDLARIGAITIGARVQYGQLYEPAYEPF